MKTMNLFRTLLLAAASCLIISAASTALAAPPVKMPRAPDHDVKIFPGALCVPVSVNYGTELADLGYAGGAVFNVGFDLETVSCPVVRDDATGADGVYMGRATVWDDSEYWDVYCCIRSYDKWGYLVDTMCDETDGSPGKQILDLTFSQSAEYGHYALECDLPGYSQGGLSAYRIYEHQDGYDDMTDYNN